MDAHSPREETAGERQAVATQPRPERSLSPDAAPLRVLVAGGEGFLGSHLIPRLLGRGHIVRATFLDEGGRGRSVAPGIEWRRADLTRQDQVEGLAESCDVVVHLAGLFSRSGPMTLARVHGTGTRNLLQGARACGAARFIYVSAVGARPGNADYFGTKFDGETAVISGGLPFVILRPTVVYGPGDRFTTTIVRLLRTLPAFPMLGNGSFLLQPLAVEDMIDALTQCVERTDLDGHDFEIAGPERLAFREIVATVARALGVRRPIIRMPGRMALTGALLAHRMRLPAPFTPEQLAIFGTGSVLRGADNPLLDVFRVRPMPFEDALADYLSGGP